MVAGILIGCFLPGIPEFLAHFVYKQVSIPIAILIWLMIYPMMLKIDFQLIKICADTRGLLISTVTSRLVKPFLMFGLATLFFCNCVSQVYSPESGRSLHHRAVQHRMTNIQVPLDVLFISAVIFVVVPLVGSALIRYFLIRLRGERYFNDEFIPKFEKITPVRLLLTLVIILSFQGEAILRRWFW